MASSIDADFTKTFLFPPALEDFVPRDHPARFIREIAETLSSKVELEWKDENGKGRPPFAAALLFRVWLYGYVHQIRTVRKLEAACREHVGLLWLTGLQTPDHNTLWRFWRLNRGTIKNAFREFVRFAAEQGMVGLALHAVDGTKIQAQCSTRQAWSRRKIEKLLARADEQITKLESEIAAHVETDDEGYRLREELATQQALRETVTARLAVLDAHEADDLNQHEPDARLMKSGVGTRLGYNAQIVADEKSGMIVAETVVTSAADQGQLLPMLDLVEVQFGTTAADTVADGGYNTEQTLVDAEEQQRRVIVAAGPSDAESNPDNPFHISRFSYDEQANVFICPQGQPLTFETVKDKGKGRRVDVYRCHATSCPVARNCTRSRRGRTVEKSPHHEVIQRHLLKRRSEEGRAKLKKRSAIVERPFACIKVHSGFTRFRAAGLLNAGAEWTWMCLAHDVKILLAKWVREVALTGRRSALPTPA